MFLHKPVIVAGVAAAGAGYLTSGENQTLLAEKQAKADELRAEYLRPAKEGEEKGSRCPFRGCGSYFGTRAGKNMPDVEAREVEKKGCQVGELRWVAGANGRTGHLRVASGAGSVRIRNRS